MSNKSVLVLSLDFPPNDGGISRLSAGAVAALEVSGVRTRVITFNKGTRSGLDRPTSIVHEVDSRKGLRDFQIFREIRRFLQEFGKDAPILATLWNPEATLAMIAGAQKYSVLAHGNEVMSYPRNGFKGQLRRVVLERAHAVVCNSYFTEKLVKRIAPKSKTAVLNPAIDANKFSTPLTKKEAKLQLGLPDDKQIILTVARLDPIKGHGTVLRAMANLPEELLSNLLYVIIGKGKMLASLVSLANELNIEPYVRFAGFVKDDDLPMWYGAADLFVLTSYVDPNNRGMEGFGMAFTEAQAAGLPVIGTRSGGIPDAVKEGEGGWLIPEHDIDALAQHLQKLLSEPEIFAEQGKLGAERVRREMSWQGYASRIIEILDL